MKRSPNAWYVGDDVLVQDSFTLEYTRPGRIKAITPVGYRIEMLDNNGRVLHLGRSYFKENTYVYDPKDHASNRSGKAADPQGR